MFIQKSSFEKISLLFLMGGVMIAWLLPIFLSSGLQKLEPSLIFRRQHQCQRVLRYTLGKTYLTALKRIAFNLVSAFVGTVVGTTIWQCTNTEFIDHISACYGYHLHFFRFTISNAMNQLLKFDHEITT